MTIAGVWHLAEENGPPRFIKVQPDARGRHEGQGPSDHLDRHPDPVEERPVIQKRSRKVRCFGNDNTRGNGVAGHRQGGDKEKTGVLRFG